MSGFAVTDPSRQPSSRITCALEPEHCILGLSLGSTFYIMVQEAFLTPCFKVTLREMKYALHIPRDQVHRDPGQGWAEHHVLGYLQHSLAPGTGVQVLVRGLSSVL